MTVYDLNLASWYRDLLFGKYTMQMRRAVRTRSPEPVVRWHAEARQAPYSAGRLAKEPPHQAASPKG